MSSLQRVSTNLPPETFEVLEGAWRAGGYSSRAQWIADAIHAQLDGEIQDRNHVDLLEEIRAKEKIVLEKEAEVAALRAEVQKALAEKDQKIAALQARVDELSARARFAEGAFQNAVAEKSRMLALLPPPRKSVWERLFGSRTEKEEENP